jgi:hypothetical protein
MDYLKAVFHEDLSTPGSGMVRVDGGRIHIGERNWPPHELLEGMGEDAYAEAFNSWRDERCEALLARADEVLTEFDQTDRFDTLKEAFRRKMVLPFLGAGMSIPSGYLGWTAFLRRTLADTGLDPAAFEALLKAGQYEQAAQEVADALGAGFNERVQAKFGTERDLRGPVQFLPFLFSDTPVITTNFDNVIKRCFRKREDHAFEEELYGLSSEELPRYLAEGKRVLLQLHGQGSSPRGRILTAREYEVAYADPALLPRAIRALCTRTILFVGCSLTVDRVIGELQRFVETEGHDRCARHYAFLAAPEDPVLRRDRARELERLNIYPVWYPLNEDNEFIEAYFYRLADGVLEL